MKVTSVAAARALGDGVEQRPFVRRSAGSKNCRVRKPCASNQPHPTRNAYVPRRRSNRWFRGRRRGTGAARVSAADTAGLRPVLARRRLSPRRRQRAIQPVRVLERASGARRRERARRAAPVAAERSAASIRECGCGVGGSARGSIVGTCATSPRVRTSEPFADRAPLQRRSAQDPLGCGCRTPHVRPPASAVAAADSRIRSAAAFASGPVLPTGPTHRDIRSRTRTRRSAAACASSSSWCMRNSGSLNPMPPG